MRFHTIHRLFILCVIVAALVSAPILACDEPAGQAEGPASGTELDLPLEIPKTDEALRASIADFLRGPLQEEPAPERVDEAVALARWFWGRGILRARTAETDASVTVLSEIIEDMVRGNPMKRLRKLSEEEAHPWELVSTVEAYAPLFERRLEGPALWIKGRPFWDRLPDGTTLRFPSGVHTIERGLLGRFQSFPRDLVFEGAGMDETLIRLQQPIMRRDEIYGLTFRDLTIDCGGEHLVDVHSNHPAIIHMVRCRVIGFMDMLEGGTAAFWGEDSVIEALSGRGFGSLFDVRKGLLARLDRCTIKGPFRSVYRAGPKATYVFSGCELLDMNSYVRRDMERHPEGVRFEGCTVEYLTRDEERDPNRMERRSLTDINPDWVVEDES